MKKSLKIVPIIFLYLLMVGCSDSGSSSTSTTSSGTDGGAAGEATDTTSTDGGTAGEATDTTGTGGDTAGAGTDTSGTAGETGGTDGGAGGAPNSTAAFAAIAGLWDYTEDEDIQYQEFHPDGTTTNWDYDGDFWGDGENCYIKFGPLSLTYLGNNEFEGFAGLTATVVVNGDQMTVTDRDGTFVYPRVVGVSSTDLTICN